MGADSEQGELGEEGGAAGLEAGRQICHVKAQVNLLSMQVYVRMEPLHTSSRLQRLLLAVVHPQISA